jgi:hypothetical protein
MVSLIPSELSVAGIYIPPALVVLLAGFLSAWAAAKLLNRLRLSRFFWYPPLGFLALWLLASSMIGLFLVSP